MSLVFWLLYFLTAVPRSFAASANDWRGRSIYQIIVDRYALPSDADTTACDPGKQTWCGGLGTRPSSTISPAGAHLSDSIREHLDYIQEAGFTAVWISPVSQNYDGPTTPYGDAYQLNDKFGTSDNLKALSSELHRRGMYLMVDVVVNDVMATSTTPDLSTCMSREGSQYHPYSVIDWSNATSEEHCWLGDTTAPLPGINTEDSTVAFDFQDWIHSLVAEFAIDGLRIDAAKHVNMDFWPPFCAAGGVFCIGEVFDSDVNNVAAYQGPNALDSVLNYPVYDALVNAFTIPGQQNMSALTNIVAQSQQKFKDCGLLGNFIENQDVPRWQNLSVDPQSLYIPIVYYGQEQGFSGGGDPWNREPLWISGSVNTTTYQLISTMNQFRNFLVNTTNRVNSSMQLLTSTSDGIAINERQRHLGFDEHWLSAPELECSGVHPVLEEHTSDQILTCAQCPVGSNGTIEVEYSQGGHPVVLIPMNDLKDSGLCGSLSVSLYTLGAQSSHRFLFGSQGLLLSFVLANSLFILYLW